MKKAMKILSFIAMAAVIGLVFSCAEPDPDAEPVYVTFTGLDNYTGKSLDNGTTVDATGKSFNDLYAKVYFYSSAGGKGEQATSGKDPIQIKNGKLEKVSMVNASGKPVGLKPDAKSPLFVWVKISKGSKDTITAAKTEIFKSKANLLFDFQIGNGVVNIKSGVNKFTLAGSDSTPGDVVPADDFFGIYTAARSSYIETVDFKENSFYISDNEKDPNPRDYLSFAIQKWEEADVPSTYSGNNYNYTGGYKFTGIITAGKPVENNSIYGSETASGFSQSDINTTQCRMYIFYKMDTAGKVTFIRSKFTKGTEAEADKTAVSGSGENGLRVFTKQ